jgi:hypothetical protein
MVKSTALFKAQKRPQRPSFTHTGLINHDFENKAIDDVITLEKPQPVPHKNFTSQSQFYTINTMKYVEKMVGDDVLH